MLVASGTYFENIVWPAVNSIKLIAEGDTSNTFIDGGGTGRVITLEHEGVDTSTVIRGFTIRNGAYNIGWGLGAGVFCHRSSPMIVRCRISNNTGTGYHGAGAGLCLTNSSAHISECTIDNNHLNCSSQAGGAGVSILDTSNVVITNSIIRSNSSAFGFKVWGSGVSLMYASHALLDSVIVAENTAVSMNGSEVRGVGISAVLGCELRIKNSVISGNRSEGTVWSTQAGAGINMESSNLYAENVEIFENHLDGGESWQVGAGISTGGAIVQLTDVVVRDNTMSGVRSEYPATGFVHLHGSFTVAERLVVTGNHVFATTDIFEQHGLAIHTWSGTLELRNSLIARNSPLEDLQGHDYQGLISINHMDEFSMTNVTVTDNFELVQNENTTALSLNHNSGANILNSIFWNPSLSSELEGSGIIIRYSDVKGGYQGEGNIDFDPNFMGEGDYRLQFPSPCIGTGTLDGAPETDILGNPRPIPLGTNPDMGAYEDDNPLTSVEDVSFSNDFRIHPNPTTGIVTVEGDFIQCRIFSTDGVMVLDFPATKGRSTIDLSGFHHGLYLIQMTDRSGRQVTDRVVVTD